MSRNKNFRPGSSFPEFRDGDVKVVITGSRQYQLHSGVLRNASPVMRHYLEEEKAAQLNRKAIKEGRRILYRIVLVENPEYEEGGPEISHTIVGVRLKEDGLPGKNAPAGVGLELENGRRLPPIFLAYDAVLGAMYNQPINLGDAQEDGLADLLSNAFQITVVAEHLDCIRIVSKPIEATLLATGQSLYKAIANNPLPWLNFAARVKSRAIFKEALIHSAGRWNEPEVKQMVLEGAIPGDVLEVLHRKGEWIKGTVSQASRYLASYYPAMLLREVKAAEKDNISRASYGNDIMMWMALTVFRHFISDCMASDRTHHAPDMGWGFINAITLGGEAYLSRRTLQDNFHPRFPMTGKGMACIEHRLAEIKDDVKQWAIPLKVNHSALDVGQHTVEHFVHINVNNNDYPWVVEEMAAEASERKKGKQRAEESDEEEEASGDDDDVMNDIDGIPMSDLEDFDEGDSPIYNTAGAADYVNDAEEYDEDEQRQMTETFRKSTAEGKTKRSRDRR